MKEILIVATILALLFLATATTLYRANTIIHTSTASTSNVNVKLYIRVYGYWDPNLRSGFISDIMLEEATGETQLAVGEGGTYVEIQIRDPSTGGLLKSKNENVGGGSWNVWLDVDDLKGRTVKVIVKLIHERIGAYGIPQPIMVDEKTKEIKVET